MVTSSEPAGVATGRNFHNTRSGTLGGLTYYGVTSLGRRFLTYFEDEATHRPRASNVVPPQLSRLLPRPLRE